MSEPYYSDDVVTLHHGDCLDVLRTLPDASVDAVVTDPPYALEFMGRGWDKFTPLEFELWVSQWAAECLRVLKPGGHMLAFGGSRTWHRLAAGIEDAGFEIRDSIAWLYGSGFPKSLDVAKAIDKQRDDTSDVRVVCRWLRERIDEHSTQTIRSIAERFGFHPRMVEHWAARDTDSQPTLPTLEQWDGLRELLGFGDELDAEVYRLNMRKGEPGEAWANREVVGTVDAWENRTNYALTSRDGLRRGESTNPAAQAWEGWGTALKPAFEPIVVARKPLVGTVAGNVLAYGTGALNIDGARVSTQGEVTARPPLSTNKHEGWQRPWNDDPEARARVEAHREAQADKRDDLGRWPANVVLDESQAAELDRQSGFSQSPTTTGRGASSKASSMSGTLGAQGTVAAPGDSGGASRFFPTFRYEAKAPTSERPKAGEVQHPTVKPLDLMRWLVRLVTPPGGVVLEPFAGSGTTVEAAVLEGFSCIAIEREAEYLPLIEQRLSKPLQQSLFDGIEVA